MITPKRKSYKNFIYIYRYEKFFYQEGYRLIAGVDEAGRGCLAGPIVTAAVILPKNFKIEFIDDSKKISAKLREELYERIIKEAIEVQTVFISAEEIDKSNVYQATISSMKKVISQFENKPDHVLVDAMPIYNFHCESSPIVRGDIKSVSIMAAAIVAKVTRDRYMAEMENYYPGFQFSKHKGYGTNEHLQELQIHGVTPIHRLSFGPCQLRSKYVQMSFLDFDQSIWGESEPNLKKA